VRSFWGFRIWSENTLGGFGGGVRTSWGGGGWGVWSKNK
jgi:hypothetical protein